MEIHKQASIHESNKSIEMIQGQLRMERLKLAVALQEYGLHGSWSEALKKFTKEIEEAEIQELTDLGEIARYLRRLEELDDQVSIFHTRPFSLMVTHWPKSPKILNAKDEFSLESLRALAAGTRVPTTVDAPQDG